MSFNVRSILLTLEEILFLLSSDAKETVSFSNTRPVIFPGFKKNLRWLSPKVIDETEKKLLESPKSDEVVFDV